MGKINADERRMMVSNSIRAAREVSEIPKSVEWKNNGAYLEEVVDRILQICEKYGVLPSMSMMASAVGVPKQVIADVKDEVIKATSDVRAVVAGFYALCENATVASTMDGGANNAAGIFILKAQYGYKEEPREVVMTHNKLIGERKDPAAIAQRYADAMVIDAGEVRAIAEDEHGW